jgi:hypothetical protein
MTQMGRSALLVAALLLILGAAPRLAWVAEGDDDCDSGSRPFVRLPAAKLIIEHNATDEDTGVHGLFDGVDWTTLCVFDPNGKQILEVEPKRQLKRQSISGIFFESAEPPNDEVPIEKILARFPEGRYPVRGRTADGKGIRGAALFTHVIPEGPVITFPEDEDIVPASDLQVTWNHVTTSIEGEPIHRTGYEVIITKDVRDDPNGFSLPVFDVHVPPSVSSLTVSNEFLQANTAYELEVLVLEVSGNQTISSLFFRTE